MDPKSVRRIRIENIKRLEESLPPLEEKLKRADLEHKYCTAANKQTGVCDIAEKRAQKLVSKFAQEHRMSTLVSGSNKDPKYWGKAGGDQKSGKKKVELIDEAATKDRDKILGDLNEELRQLDEKCRKMEELISGIDQVISECSLSDLEDEEDLLVNMPRPCVEMGHTDEETYEEAVEYMKKQGESQEKEENKEDGKGYRSSTSDTSEDTDG